MPDLPPATRTVTPDRATALSSRPAGARTTDPLPADMPLTERILRRLPGPRLVWIVVWALTAPARPLVLLLVFTLTGEASRIRAFSDVFITQGVFGYVVLVSVWGTLRVATGVRRIGPDIERLAPDRDATRLFRRIESRTGPIALTAITVALATPSTAVDYGATIALIDLPLLTLMVLPIMTFIWTYLALLAGLHRLGGEPLVLDRFPEDRTLGLAPVGSVAFTGFVALFLAAVPAIGLTGPDLTTFSISVGSVVVIVALLVLSMVRLHGQMRAAKARYVALTRSLVADAYGPVRADPTLGSLEARSSALGAAQSLADRADRILEWPIDERPVAFVTVVLTGVITSLLVRFVLVAFGG